MLTNISDSFFSFLALLDFVLILFKILLIHISFLFRISEFLLLFIEIFGILDLLLRFVYCFLLRSYLLFFFQVGIFSPISFYLFLLCLKFFSKFLKCSNFTINFFDFIFNTEHWISRFGLKLRNDVFIKMITAWLNFILIDLITIQHPVSVTEILNLITYLNSHVIISNIQVLFFESWRYTELVLQHLDILVNASFFINMIIS